MRIASLARLPRVREVIGLLCLVASIALVLSLLTFNPADPSWNTASPADPPHNARVTFEANWAASGWDAPEIAPWLEQSLEAASRSYFGQSAAYMGEGGTIPFMAMLGERFPDTQFLITGVLGPQSNAHGPNEFLHIPTGKRLTACVARVIADQLVAAATT